MASMKAQARQHAKLWQLGACALCGVAIALCGDDCRDMHLDSTISQRMPRFRREWSSRHATLTACDRLHRGNPHAALVTIDGRKAAAHISCASSFQTMVYRANIPMDEQRAIERLRKLAGLSVTCRLRISPVENPQKAQLESATRAPRKAQPPSGTTPELPHSVEQQSLGTQVEAQLARARTCPNCGASVTHPIPHPYVMPCCEHTLTLDQLWTLA